MNKSKNKSPHQDYLAPVDMEAQEHLTLKRLAALSPRMTDKELPPRPGSNFIDLIKWAENCFVPAGLNDQKDISRFVHNRIIIDGPFLQFCEETGVDIECLYQDSIVSWKTDTKMEKFFAQGVFRISNKNVEFLHAALFHKGNSNEDEISFFILASQKNYEGYVALRNQFDEWVQLRDRSNLHIRVIDGEDIPYTRDTNWDDLFLPENDKKEIRYLVENFLNSRDFYLKNKIPWKRGFLLFGKPGNGKTSIIRTIIAQYNFKPVTIVPGCTVDFMREAFRYAEEQSPSLLYFEDLDSLIENGLDVSSFLNMLDGISTKNGLLVIATANNVKKLKSNITNRPSRFDRKFEIPLPNQENAYIYLKRWFGSSITTQKCRELAKYAERYEFSYAYLKELYISSMFEALAHKRQAPTTKDIDNALNCLIKDKNILGNDKAVDTDRYFK